MIAVDTNIVVRLITNDDPIQVERVLALLQREDLFVSHTVLIEAEWVLRSAYRYDRLRIANALFELSDLTNLHFQAEEDVRWALGRYRVAGEFADYVHIAAARPIGRFASFERKLAVRAGPDSPAAIEVLT
ncbi:type II toxin-antitoxin system VapC family toxin [Sphingomonas sp. H39-1-10]|uniref:type II toxin-antitoxin system VapC family toxin n=1 Tax=Sphingomonas pollutisoli TaxID=3030829 RepID=UPI0023B90E00|nr:type II toxin-antitoxin system VapC family toxin [Sphingomonas pollutisoli]MDF0487014.1 type II toxin-antitoxin system VapC family toxin [Sphingomonas pollutisoli]